MSFSHVYGSCWAVWNGFAIFCRGFYSITATQFMFGTWWPPMFTYLYHSLCVLLFSFMVYFISWCLLMCYLCSFMFIYFHLFSFIFIYFPLFSFIFIYFHFFSFFHVLLFFSLEKTIANLNHLHVDPRLNSAESEWNHTDYMMLWLSVCYVNMVRWTNGLDGPSHVPSGHQCTPHVFT